MNLQKENIWTEEIIEKAIRALITAIENQYQVKITYTLKKKTSPLEQD